MAADVWNTLSKVDVSDHIETIEAGSYRINYLSWSWAWATLMNHYPCSEFILCGETTLENGTVETRVVVRINTVDGTISREMWLPVMDRRNNAIVNPDARQISDARMRCLVKCLALFGLGLDLWTGSDSPVGVVDDPLSPQQLEEVNELIEQAEPDIVRFLKWLQVDTVEDIPYGKFKQCKAELERAIARKAK
jgi:hypothetical protein